MLSLLALPLAVFAAHPNSVSSSRITVEGRHVDLRLRFEAGTLIEAVPVDANGDRKIDAAELASARGDVASYVLGRYTLTADCAGTASSGERLVGRLLELGFTQADAGGLFPPEPLVDIDLSFESERELSSLCLEFALFRESNPWHRDHAEIVWNGASPQARLLWIEDPSWVFAPEASSNGSVVGSYVSLGIAHILTGYDHIAFLIALIVASRRVRSLLAVVTAFTLAHSVSLACAATGLVEVSPRLVEPAIALSIAFVGLRNVLEKSQRRMWPEAFGFGLVHGLGFAGSIAETLAAEPEKLKGLFGFNLGVEIGQVAIVAAVVLVLRVVQRSAESRANEDLRLAPRWIRFPASSVVSALGIYWFIARVWFG